MEERASGKAARAQERVREAQVAWIDRNQEVRARTGATERRGRYGADGEQETGVLLRES